jgi:hypothetical protein
MGALQTPADLQAEVTEANAKIFRTILNAIRYLLFPCLLFADKSVERIQGPPPTVVPGLKPFVEDMKQDNNTLLDALNGRSLTELHPGNLMIVVRAESSQYSKLPQSFPYPNTHCSRVTVESCWGARRATKRVNK